MTAGPWKPVTLEVSIACIENVQVDYELSKDFKSASGNVNVRTEGSANKATASLSFNGSEVARLTGEVNGSGLAALPFTLGTTLPLMLQSASMLILDR